MEPETQAFIEHVMIRTGINFGVGIMTREDVRQHLCEQALETARRYDGSTKFLTYLYPRLVGECNDLLRANGTRFRHSGRARPLMLPLEMPADEDGDFDSAGDNFADQDDDLETVSQLADLKTALAGLPERMRAILYYVYFEGLTMGQAAGRLGITVGLARELRDAAMTKMRVSLLVDGRAAPDYPGQRLTAISIKPDSQG